MNDKHLDRLRKFLDYVSVAIVATVFFLIAIISFWLIYPSNHPELDNHEYSISISIDNTTESSQYDSLLSQVNLELEKISSKTSDEINEQLSLQKEQFAAFREAELRQNQFLTYASALIAIIAALGGFFGFRSITDVKKSIKLQVEEIAKEEAKDAAKKINEGSFKTNLESTVTGYVEENFLRLYEVFERQLNDLEDRIDECCPDNPEHDNNGPEQAPNDNEPVIGLNASRIFNDEQL